MTYLLDLLNVQIANDGILISSPYTYINENIVAFKRANKERYNKVCDTLTTDNIISTSSSES